MPRLLLLLPQLPQDPASGAARSMRAACQVLAAAGWAVRALAVTATEATAGIDAAALLRGAGLDLTLRLPNRAVYRHDRPVLVFTDADGIVHQLLDTGRCRAWEWQAEHEAQFNRLFQRELTDHRPDVIYTYGGTPGDGGRCQRARAAGCVVVFALHNLGYLARDWAHGFSAVITPSRFLQEIYRRETGLESVVLPPLLNPAETVAADRQPLFATAVNPSPEKGGFFLARLAEELSVRRPDLPMLFVESRGSAGRLVEAGLAGGFDLRRHRNLMFAPAVAQPRDFFRGTRVLLAPSVCEEAFGRVAAEALLNGVPPLVSDRGGLPEAANGGGFVLPLPASLTLETRAPVAAADVAAWLEVMLKLADDPACYSAASQRALAAGQAWHPDRLNPRYVEFFTSLLTPAP